MIGDQLCKCIVTKLDYQLILTREFLWQHLAQTVSESQLSFLHIKHNLIRVLVILVDDLELELATVLEHDSENDNGGIQMNYAKQH